MKVACSGSCRVLTSHFQALSCRNRNHNQLLKIIKKLTFLNKITHLGHHWKICWQSQQRDTTNGEVWNLWYLLSLVRAKPKEDDDDEDSSTAEPRLLLNGPNLFYKLMKDIPSFFNSTKFVTKIKIAHTTQIPRPTSKVIVSSSPCDGAHKYICMLKIPIKQNPKLPCYYLPF